MDSDGKSMGEYAIVPISGPSREKEYKHVPGSGPFSRDTRAGAVFGEQPRSNETGQKEYTGVVDGEVKDNNGGGRPDGTTGTENRTIHVLDKDTGTYKDIDEKDFDPKKHMKDVVDGEVKEVEIGEEEEMSKDDFLNFVKDARIPNTEYSKGGETKTKRDTARKKLRDEEINVDYITCRDLPGADKTAKDKRSERNDEIDSLMEAVGNGKVTAEQKAKLISEDIGLTEERLDEWGVEEGVVAVELNEKQKREKLISDNEDLYRELFFADFDQDVWEQNEDRIVELWSSFRGENVLQKIINDGFPYTRTLNGNFSLLREAYMQHIFGEEVLADLRSGKENLDKTIATLKDPDPSRRAVAENLLRSQRPALESKIKGKTMGVGNSRGWPTIDSGLAGDYMLKYFELKEAGDNSDYGAVVKNLKRAYLQVGQIRGSVDVAIANEPKVELMRQMIQVHDLCVEVDSATFRTVENLRLELTQKIDESLIAMLSIKKGGVSVVPKVIATYDAVMRHMYDYEEGKEINIDDKTVEDRVKAGLVGVFDTDEELNLFMRMGKDVCKLTGIDAQYGYPYDVQPGDKRGLATSVRGAFFRGIFNFNTALVTYNKTNDPDVARLNSGIKLGAIPFWNKQRKDEPEEKMTESAPLTVSKIVEIVNTKLVGNANYEGWLGSMKGYAEAKKAESDFMTNSPTLGTFVEKVVPAYMGYLQFTPDKGRGYLLNRLTICMSYFLNQPDGESKTRASVQSMFLKDNNFDGRGLFNSVDEMNKWYKKVSGVNLDTREYYRKDMGDTVYKNEVNRIKRGWLYRNTVGRFNRD